MQNRWLRMIGVTLLHYPRKRGNFKLHLLIAWSNFRDLQMFLKKEMLFIIALVLLAFGYASTGSNANDELTTTPAISSNENNDNANPSPDFDGDGTVGISDFLLFVDVFGSRQGDEGYDARFDLDSNGTIGISDFLIFVENFGKEVLLDDRAVLVRLYEATNGPNWTNKENWLSTAPLGDWHGVTTDTNGRVVYLSLRDNNLRGPIPAQLAQLINLTSLSLNANQLTGTIPTELAQLTNLTWLNLSVNQLTGTIPTELAQLTNLTFLNLGVNQLTGAIPTELAQLINLTSLSLNANQLTGTIPTELAQLTNLTSLSLNANQLTGTIPTELAQLTNLTWLFLDRNQLTGAIPAGLAQLTNLTFLVLGGNQLTGTIPTELAQLTNLTWLFLDRNQLTGAIPAGLAQLTNLTFLNLGGNQLTGVIPAGLAQLTNLTDLNLGGNQLTGVIPAGLAQLTNLTDLNLGFNQLTGVIPAGLAQLTNLTDLNLGFNQLTGTIPTELAQLTNLTQLILSGNADLSGPLPPAFANLSLEYLGLSGTGVCVPLTGAFVKWLDSIPAKRGDTHCADPERDALIALYKQTNGPNWTNNKNWTTLEPLGDWYGVTTNADGRVTELNLRDNNLSGLLPLSLSNLANLKTLNLAFNAALSGPLPQGFTRLTLESLELEETRLCAPPLAEFQMWVNGIRESEVAQCTDARPDYYALVALYSGTKGANWTNATNWASDAPLGGWYGVTTDASERVTELSLNDNNLQGTIPVELGQLSNLESLSLSANQLTDEIPPELGQLTNLASLNLSTNQISGNIPRELGQLTNLDSLILAYNKLTGEIPTELAQLSNLEGLDLSKNQLTGNIPSELGSLTSLRTLDLSGNPLDGEIPAELGQLANLESLILWPNNLTGEIPTELGKLTNLRRLWLVNNFLTGNIPPELGQLTNLTSLELGSNQLTGNIPPELGQLTNLTSLELGSNQLTGNIPPELGQLTNLRNLSLSTNQLSGNIPSELRQLKNLWFLRLHKNQLSGSIPSELGQLTNLASLNLSTNQLTGNIPSELAQLTNLKELNLSTNQLSGNIPPELAQLTNLDELNLGFNGALSGTLPNALTGLTLESLRLDETLLCSPQDPGFQTWLRAIPFTRVPNCARSDEVAAYLVQATQSLEYPVPLVAGEAALLRVFVTAEQEVNATMPPVRATFYRDGVEVHTANIGGQTTNIPRLVNEASLLNSANAVVPGSVVMPGLEMVVEIDPDQTLDPALGIATRLPQTGRTALDVKSVPPFELTLIPFLWEENPDRSVVTQTEGLSSESDLFRLTRDILPVSEFRLTVHEPVLTSVDPTSDASGKLGSQTELIYALEGAKGYYMAIFRSVGQSRLKGIARLPGYTSQSILDGNTIAHELGHNLDLLHAPGCGAGGPDPEYPYEDGAIGAWGYDFVNKSLVSPATSDLMTYCDPQWISDYSFTRALAHRSQVESAPLAATKVSSTRGLLIWGGLDENEKPFLEPAFVVSAPPSLPRIDGPYTLTGEDEHGNNLFSIPFGIPEYGCGGKGGAFAFILPVQDDWAGRLARIALSGPGGVSILDGEGGLSATLLLDRTTGHVRGILRGSQAAAKRSATSLLPPEPGLEVLTSHGIPFFD